MAEDFDRSEFLEGFKTTVKTLPEAERLARQLREQGFERLYFVGPGAPNRAMQLVDYWVDRWVTGVTSRRYYPAEFIAQNPAELDEKTLVLLGSKSGTTPETVEAAKFVRATPATTVGFTQTKDLPLATSVDHALLMGETDQSHSGMFMLLLAFVSAFLNPDDGWQVHDKVMTSLKALPEALAAATEQNDARAAEEARIYKDDRIIYHVASGPMFSAAYTFGICVLMEMQWMHSMPIEAAEFFHGPFEVVDETTPLILYLGEDPARPLAERVVRFCKKYTERLMIYDSEDFEMPGIDPDIRPIVGPLVVDAALNRLAKHLAVWHNHPLSTRRYMWKTEY